MPGLLRRRISHLRRLQQVRAGEGAVALSKEGVAVTPPEVEAVLKWHEALNDGDIEGLLALSDPDVEMGGPRGTVHGARMLREWVNRANIRLEPRRVFHRARTVVVEQEAEWRSAGTGEVAGRQTVASVFVVRDGLVTSVARHDDLAGALGAAGLDEMDGGS